MARQRKSERGSRAEAQGAKVANTKCEGKNPLRLPHRVYSPTGRALRSALPARINCR
jgi:hypothetical protein